MAPAVPNDGAVGNVLLLFLDEWGALLLLDDLLPPRLATPVTSELPKGLVVKLAAIAAAAAALVESDYAGTCDFCSLDFRTLVSLGDIICGDLSEFLIFLLMGVVVSPFRNCCCGNCAELVGI